MFSTIFYQILHYTGKKWNKGEYGYCVNEDSYDQAALNQINLSFYRTSSYNLCFFCLKPSKLGVILLTIIRGTLKALEIVVKKEMDTRWRLLMNTNES